MSAVNRSFHPVYACFLVSDSEVGLKLPPCVPDDASTFFWSGNAIGPDGMGALASRLHLVSSLRALDVSGAGRLLPQRLIRLTIQHVCLASGFLTYSHSAPLVNRLGSEGMNSLVLALHALPFLHSLGVSGTDRRRCNGPRWMPNYSPPRVCVRAC